MQIRMPPAASETSIVPPAAYSHVPRSPVFGISGPRTFVTLNGTIAETEPLSSVMATGSPLTVAEAVRPGLPHTAQITSFSAVVIFTVIGSFRSRYLLSVAISVNTYSSSSRPLTVIFCVPSTGMNVVASASAST